MANEAAGAPVGWAPGDQASLATGELGRTSREGGTSLAGQSEPAGHHVDVTRQREDAGGNAVTARH